MFCAPVIEPVLDDKVNVYVPGPNDESVNEEVVFGNGGGEEDGK